jgi:peptidoglycan hydrolase-like protein with peptidoglycan-binding domain
VSRKLLSATLVLLLVACSKGSPESDTADQSASTAAVERGPLSTMVSRAGFLTYRAAADGSRFTVINRATGTYTGLPAVGDEVACGDVLYRVDERPVLLLCGAVPAYRDLHVGDAGADVRQLNQSLLDLGFAAEAESDVFTATTALALAQLQMAKGLDVTGALAIDDAVFLPSSVRVAEVSGALGGTAQSGAPVLRATSDALEVQVELDALQRDAVQVGDAARITLPGNASATGKVDRIGTITAVPTGPDAAGGTTLGAYISLDDADAVSGLDKAAVQVEIATTGVDDALSVPVTAIFGTSGGGFAVEVVGDGGRRELVDVELGVFDTAGGRVQVDGDVREGDLVVVPTS